jgi:hypothetical protein
MQTLMPIVLIAAACGGTFGFFVLGQHRALFALFDGESEVQLLGGLCWRVLLYPGVLLGVPTLLVAFVGFYPMKPIEFFALFLASLVCSAIGEKAFARRKAQVVRNARTTRRGRLVVPAMDGNSGAQGGGVMGCEQARCNSQ